MPTMEVLVRLPDGLPAMVDAVRHERLLRPLLMRMLRHVSEMAQHCASLSLFSSFLT